jgi:CTP:molybdopterin cytidylyltransferase MocA
MGAFKPLLPFGKQTVIESSISSLRASGVKDIIVVVGHRGDEIREKLKSTEVSFVINPDADTPMGTSIALGVSQVNEQTEAVLILPADHPAIPARTIKLILQEWEDGATLVQPEYEGRGGHPVLIDLRYREQLRNLDPNKGLRGLFDNHRPEVRRLLVDSPFIARDMDTWEDYLALHREVFGRLPDTI